MFKFCQEASHEIDDVKAKMDRTAIVWEDFRDDPTEHQDLRGIQESSDGVGVQYATMDWLNDCGDLHEIQGMYSQLLV